MNTQPRVGLMTSLLSSRPLCVALAAAALAHVGLELAGLGGWPCPVRSALGVPCPGCGLGRASAALLRGDAAAALAHHAFAPVAVGAVAVLTAAASSERLRRWFVAGFARLEARFPLAPITLGALLIYWLGRLWLDHRALIS